MANVLCSITMEVKMFHQNLTAVCSKNKYTAN